MVVNLGWEELGQESNDQFCLMTCLYNNCGDKDDDDDEDGRIEIKYYYCDWWTQMWKSLREKMKKLGAEFEKRRKD